MVNHKIRTGNIGKAQHMGHSNTFYIVRYILREHMKMLGFNAIEQISNTSENIFFLKPMNKILAKIP